MPGAAYGPGMLVRHPLRSEWGLGKVLAVHDDKISVYFKDDSQDVRRISVDHVALEVVEGHIDSLLDNLPPFLGDRFDVKAKKVTFAEGRKRFEEIFPRGFCDPAYLGSGRVGKHEFGERHYKWSAHERCVEALGSGRGEKLFADGKLDELVERACTVVSKDLNLLSPFENMAFRDGLSGDSAAAERFFQTLFAFIAAGIPRQESFEPFSDALMSLPVEEGKARVATWPVLTILPFLAHPDRFMFLKPEPTKECADRMRFNLQYSADLSWLTYHKLMQMSDQLLKDLRPLGATDYIDVQSFIWVIAKY